MPPARRARWWRYSLLAVPLALALVLAATLTWLKLHEADLVFVTALSHERALGELPHDSERLTLHGPDSALDALLLRPEPSRDTGFWILHLHGNADTAFSKQQLEHVAALRDLGFAVLAFDYRGFGRSAGVASEAHMEQDAYTAYEALIARGVAPERIILWGHSLGSGPAVWLATRERAAALVLFGAFTSIPDAAQDQISVSAGALARERALRFPLVDRAGAPAGVDCAQRDRPPHSLSSRTGAVRGGA